jgi:hypothetical protein
VIPQVAASERGSSPNRVSVIACWRFSRGVVGLTYEEATDSLLKLQIFKVDEAVWKDGPQKVIAL